MLYIAINNDIFIGLSVDKNKFRRDISAQNSYFSRPLQEKARFGLSSQLLLLSAIVILIMEAVLFFPSLGRFKNQWLQDKLNDAAIVVVSFSNSPAQILTPRTVENLLSDINIESITFKTAGQSEVIGNEAAILSIDHNIDLNNRSIINSSFFAIQILFSDDIKTLFISGSPSINAVDELAIILEIESLKADITDYSIRIGILSLILSIVTGGVIYITVYTRTVQPLEKMTSHLVHFANDPTQTTDLIFPKRHDEISHIAFALNHMAHDIQSALQQKEHLARLGLAISKINHDLRNILTSTQLISDRISDIEDPMISKLGGRLEVTVDRAISYCNDMLSYGKLSEIKAVISEIRLASFIDDIAADLQIDTDKSFKWHNLVDEDVNLYADPDLLYRIIVNLLKNAKQAIQDDRCPLDGDEKYIAVMAEHDDQYFKITVTDNGVTIPHFLKANLFAAFHTSGKENGTGLGLAIAKELMHVQQGDIMFDDRVTQNVKIGQVNKQFTLLFPLEALIQNH